MRSDELILELRAEFLERRDAQHGEGWHFFEQTFNCFDFPLISLLQRLSKDVHRSNQVAVHAERRYGTLVLTHLRL